jgi:hypothetical protein
MFTSRYIFLFKCIVKTTESILFKKNEHFILQRNSKIQTNKTFQSNKSNFRIGNGGDGALQNTQIA